MMSRLLILLCATAMTLGLATRASALPYDITHADQNIFLDSFATSTHIYTFDFDNDTLDVGDISPSDIILSSFLTVSVDSGERFQPTGLIGNGSVEEFILILADGAQ